MQKGTTTIISNNNRNLVVNNAIIANSIEVSELNVTDDVYINNSLFTPVGSILTYAGASAPTGWLICDGSEVSKETYPRLFAVLGSLYGNPVNSSNFVLPNLADRVPVGKSGGNVLGNSGGNSSITLLETQLPSHSHTGTTDSNGSHSHTINDPQHSHSQTTVNDDFNNSGGNGYPFNSNPSFAGWDSAGSRTWNNISSSSTGITLNSNGTHTHTFTTGSTGTGSTIDIRNKFVVLNYIIRY